MADTNPSVVNDRKQQQQQQQHPTTTTTIDKNDDSFSSDSDDEFLMKNGDNFPAASDAGGSHGDREAMIRRKLLESFYGKDAAGMNVNQTGTTAAAARKRRGSEDSHDTSDDDDEDDDDGQTPAAAKDDLDSPQFQAAVHTQTHVWNDSVHPLLETEEALACQVRTLDSRLQTLVYENYSRFIEATDAIRSIGVQVQAHRQPLTRLQSALQTASDASRGVEIAVGPLRDQVVEQRRVQRLLQRLDTVLKLPTTLQAHVSQQQYRWATLSYVKSQTILAKHSAGFESLQRIETECHRLMTQLVKEVRQKLCHWSGMTSAGSTDGEDKEQDPLPRIQDEDDNVDDQEGGSLPDPPQSISEIMECAGALVLIIRQQQQQQQPLSAILPVDTPSPSLDPRLTLDDCQEMATSACQRFLERILDAHHIELQEQQHQQNAYNSAASTSTTQAPVVRRSGSAALLDDPAATTAADATATATNNLVPTHVLESILEVATLYTRTFLEPDGYEDDDDDDDENTNNAKKDAVERLAQFVSTAFASFLQHVRGELLEQALWQQQQQQQQQTNQARAAAAAAAHKGNVSSPDAAAVDLHAEEQKDKYEEQMAAAMATLVLSVRQLAAGLSIGATTTKTTTAAAASSCRVSPELAASLVDQTVGLTETMVRRRVDQKLDTLQLRVIMDCLQPFCDAVQELSRNDEPCVDGHNDENEEHQDQPPPLLAAVQLASVALSDSLQLVDDAIRSILSKSMDDGSDGRHRQQQQQQQQQQFLHDTDSMNGGDDEINDSMLRQAVEYSTKRFAKWLASAMEQLAGYESSSDPKLLLDAPAVQSDDVDDDMATAAVEENGRYGESSSTASKMKKMVGGRRFSGNHDDYDHKSVDQDDDMRQLSIGGLSDGLVEKELLALVNSSSSSSSRPKPNLVMILALAEMCRVAERSVMDNIQQAIASHGVGASGNSGGGGGASGSGGGTTSGGVGTSGAGIVKRKASTTTSRGDGLFSEQHAQEHNQKNRAQNPISERFRLAASRILSLFAMNRGYEAATLFCSTLPELSTKHQQQGTRMMEVQGPRQVVCQILDIAKATSLDCADLFGGKRRAGPIPDTLVDEYASLTASRVTAASGVSSSGNRSGLVFDVERIFAEKVVVYPHPNDMADFQCNSVMAMMFKVAFKAIIENCRLLRFSFPGYRQLKVDIEFLKWFLPHFIKDETLPDGSNARTALTSLLTEIISTVKDRCHDDPGEENSFYKNQHQQDVQETNRARAIIRQYMKGGRGHPSFCIDED